MLLTRDVLAHRAQYLHAREALERMLALGVVPIVNENDTVVVDELRLGDNDRLAAIVSHLVGAGMLVILTDTAGLYSDDPRLADDAELLSAVRHTDEILDALWQRSPPGRSGLAALPPRWRGPDGRLVGHPHRDRRCLQPRGGCRAVAGDEVGTWVEPHEARLTARKLWIAFGVPAQGKLVVDAGAARALLRARWFAACRRDPGRRRRV